MTAEKVYQRICKSRTKDQFSTCARRAGRLIPREVRPAVDLLETGDPRLNSEPATHIVAILSGLCWQRWAGSDERHVSGQHVESFPTLTCRKSAGPTSLSRII